MKIAYCGYDFFHNCLRELLSNDFQVAKVFTVNTNNRDNFNQYIIEICREHNIRFSYNPISETDIKQLASENFDLIITAAYNYKVPDLTGHNIKGVNIHPSLLPIGRGVWPLPWTILLDLPKSGITLHKLTPEMDAGDILMQQSFTVTKDESNESLSAKSQMLATPMLLDLLRDIDRYWSKAKKQSQGEVWPMPSKKDRTLDWNKSIEQLDRICRAFGKFGCYARFEQQQWIIYSLKAWQQDHNYTVGTVVHKTNTEMIVAAADGLVSLLYFQRSD